MAGHMGAEQKTVLNLLVVLADLERGLLFVEGSVPGPKSGIVTVTRGRKPALTEFNPPTLPSTGIALDDVAEVEADVEMESPDSPDSPDSIDSPDSPDTPDTPEDTVEAPEAEAESADATEADEEEKEASQ